MKSSNSLIITLIGLAICLPLFFMPIKGHDAVNHIIVFKLFSEQFLAGDYFPRWLNNAENGFGSPAISYFPILHYYLSLPFFPLAKFGMHLPLYASATLAVILSGIFFYQYLAPKTTTSKALLGAIFYMTFPYHLGIDYYYRFAFSEIWVLTFFPLALLFIEKDQFLGTALSTAAIFLSHLLLAPILCAVLLAKIILQNDSKLIWAVALGILLTALHNYPAITNSHLISSQLGIGIYDYKDNFIQFDNTRGISLALAGFICLIFMHPKSYFWSVILFFSLFMCFEPSKFIWEAFPPLQMLSFPWRLLMLAGIAATILSAHSSRKLLSAAIILSIIISLPFIQFQNTENPQKYLKQHILTVDDFRPQTVPQKLVVASGFKTAPKISVPTKIKTFPNLIAVSSSHAGWVKIPHFYFPNWMSTHSLRADLNGLMEVSFDGPGDALLFYGTDKNSRIGGIISIISLLALAVIAIYSAYANRRKNSY